MDEKMREDFLKQHIERYRSAILEIISNNTSVLVDDILSFIGKPPLDSMDFIQSKFLDLAKKNKIVLNTEELKDLLGKYRSELIKCCDMIQAIRIRTLVDKVEKFDFSSDNVFSFYKKDFSSLNKEIRKILKKQLSCSLETILLEKMISVFPNDIDESVSKKMSEEVLRYMKGNYQRQILETLDMKLLVKDTTLMNSVKEQGDRYLFTLKNSRLFNLE